METMNTLNTTDGWENIVNGNAVLRASARERVAVRKRVRKIKKLLYGTVGMGVACITSVILGAAGALATWLTTAIAIGCLASAFFLFGRFVEVRNVDL